MRKSIFTILILLFLFLSSCRSFLPETPPINQTKTDTIQESVFVELPEKSKIIVPKETLVETESDTTVLTKLKEEIILPKNTQIVLKQDTAMVVSDKQSIILPEGTKVETQKTNWYAILLYAGLIISGAWIFINKK